MVYPARQHVLKTFEKLFDSLPSTEKAKPQILLLASSVTPFRNDTDRELPFRQESNFFYLSGCTVPGSYLLLISQFGTSLANTPSVELFIPKAEPADLMWSVPPPSLEAARQIHDAAVVEHVDSLPEAITRHLKAFPEALVHTLPRNSPLFPDIPEAYTAPILAATAATDAYLIASLHRARLTKTPAEIEHIRNANAISSRAHEVVMRVLGLAVKGKITPGAQGALQLPGQWLIEKEAEAEAIFVASCRREGSVHQAYLPIVAASNRASTLHYCCNDKAFAWGPVNARDNHADLAHSEHKLSPQVLLIDAGCEWECYASDITRTMPVGNGGKFTPEARAIYSLVLEMQKASFEIIKAGLHWDAVQLACHRTLVHGFQRLGIFPAPDAPNSGSWNSEEAILASGVSSAFFPHGVGHSLGLDVHDVPSASRPDAGNKSVLGHASFYDYLRLRVPLETNMVVTVEPGIYFSPHLLAPIRDSRHIDHAVLARYETVGGVRIEDVIVVTNDGYENLTTVKSDIDWVEGVCSGEI